MPFAHPVNARFGTEIHHSGWTVPALAAIVLTVGVMIVFAFAVQHFVFRHLVNQEPIIFFMATIGLAYFLEGFGDLMWGSQIKTLDIGLPQGINETIDRVTFEAFGYAFFIDKLDITAAAVTTVLVAALVLFSQYTRQGRALRAVADHHQAALSVGISLGHVWVLVWSIAGFVALVAGVMWGAKSGVQFSLSLIAQGAAGADARRLHLDPGRDRRRTDHSDGREALRVPGGPAGRRRDRELVRLRAGADRAGGPAQGLFGERIIERV